MISIIAHGSNLKDSAHTHTHTHACISDLEQGILQAETLIFVLVEHVNHWFNFYKLKATLQNDMLKIPSIHPSIIYTLLSSAGRRRPVQLTLGERHNTPCIGCQAIIWLIYIQYSQTLTFTPTGNWTFKKPSSP